MDSCLLVQWCCSLIIRSQKKITVWGCNQEGIKFTGGIMWCTSMLASWLLEVMRWWFLWDSRSEYPIQTKNLRQKSGFPFTFPKFDQNWKRMPTLKSKLPLSPSPLLKGCFLINKQGLLWQSSYSMDGFVWASSSE